MEKERVDILVVQQGLTDSREKAKTSCHGWTDCGCSKS